TIYSSLNDKAFPAGMGISGDRTPYWSDDASALFFGIKHIEKSDKPKADSTSSGKKDGAAKAGKDSLKIVGLGGKDSINKKNVIAAGKDSSNKKSGVAAKKDDIDKPDMIIWNWQDKRLQSQQEVQEKDDKAYSYISEYLVASKHFI